MNVAGASLVSLALTAFGAIQTANSPTGALQGTWVMTSAAGRELPPGVHAAITFSGEKYEGISNGIIDERGIIRVTPGTTPMPIDMSIAVGPSAGKTQLGLVAVEGDTMTLILADPGDAKRPAPASTESRLTLTRVKPLARELEGTWEGAIDSRGTPVPIVIVLKNGADGLPAGTVSSPGQTTRDLPIAAVLQMGTNVRLLMPSIRATYDGKLAAGVLTGVFAQGRVPVPLELKKK
jgi:uncharacterized protein (TIGR03067 family)